jgi:hypothetical protein
VTTTPHQPSARELGCRACCVAPVSRFVSGALLLAACGDDDELSQPADQATADDAIAAVEQVLRDDGFEAASPDNEDDDDDDLSFQSEACRRFEAVASPLSARNSPVKPQGPRADLSTAGSLSCPAVSRSTSRPS